MYSPAARPPYSSTNRNRSKSQPFHKQRPLRTPKVLLLPTERHTLLAAANQDLAIENLALQRGVNQLADTGPCTAEYSRTGTAPFSAPEEIAQKLLEQTNALLEQLKAREAAVKLEKDGDAKALEEQKLEHEREKARLFNEKQQIEQRNENLVQENANLHQLLTRVTEQIQQQQKRIEDHKASSEGLHQKYTQMHNILTEATEKLTSEKEELMQKFLQEQADNANLRTALKNSGQEIVQKQNEMQQLKANLASEKEKIAKYEEGVAAFNRMINPTSPKNMGHAQNDGTDNDNLGGEVQEENVAKKRGRPMKASFWRA